MFLPRNGVLLPRAVCVTLKHPFGSSLRQSQDLGNPRDNDFISALALVAILLRSLPLLSSSHVQPLPVGIAVVALIPGDVTRGVWCLEPVDGPT